MNELPNPLVAVDNSWEMMRTLLGDTSRRSLALAALSEPDCSGDPTAAVLLRLQDKEPWIINLPRAWLMAKRGEERLESVGLVNSCTIGEHVDIVKLEA